MCSTKYASQLTKDDFKQIHKLLKDAKPLKAIVNVITRQFSQHIIVKRIY